MATANVNGVRLYYELTDEKGPPLVFVHGSWDCHTTWNRVVPHLAKTFRVLTYDRRGHSNSERLPGSGRIHEDTEDLATLMEELGLVPAWVAGNSFGASIALRLAGQRPELFRGLIGHEPPLYTLLAKDPAFSPLLQEVKQTLHAVVERIDAGDHAGAAERFVEIVALGPSSWAQLPTTVQQMMIENAPTFLEEARDAEQLTFDLELIRHFSRPTLLTLGDQSPPTFLPVVVKLTAALSCANIHTFQGAGHIPHASHPGDYVESILAFTRKHARIRPRKREW